MKRGLNGIAGEGVVRIAQSLMDGSSSGRAYK